MDVLIRRLLGINVGAVLVLIILFLSLLVNGANSAASAALLSAILLLMLATWLTLAKRTDLGAIITVNWPSITAIVALLAWSAATTTPFHLIAGVQPDALWSVARVDQAPLSLSPYRTWEGAVALLGPSAAFLLGALAAPHSQARDWVGRWLVVLAVAYAFVGLYVYFSTQATLGGRLDVGVSSANAAATIFGVLALVAAGLLVRAARGRFDRGVRHALPSSWRWAEFAFKAPLSLAAIILVFSCLLLTASRGGLVATLAAFLIFAVALGSQGLKNSGARTGAIAAPVLGLAVLFAILFLRGGEEVLRRFALAGEDMEGRQMLAAAHWREFLDRPLIGAGLNTYHELNALAATPANWTALSSPGSTHNIYVQALEETGVVGFALLALALAGPLLRALARIVSRKSGAEWAAVALGVSALVLLHGAVDFGLQVPAIAALFAFILGASVGRSNRATHQ